MEVSQLKELDTHAVIGGGQAASFELSNSAEFFTILSSTLYRDKKLAVVREVVCNAWDAHIMAGKTDVPVDIKVTDTELVIRDFGPGIPHDQIVPIYCVYGGSTKAKDETQTGGFGLGSKAPFAYSDHFTVTNRHAGKRVLYAISRGGTETEGRPDIRAMVNVPDLETGVTVTIPLKDSYDRSEFVDIIQRVAYLGGMRVAVNGGEINYLDYTEADKRGYCLLSDSQLREAKVYVRYGTVLYPVTANDEHLFKLEQDIGRMLGNYRVVLMAPPNSIGVTPSRESLSYTETTIETVRALTERFSKELKQSVPAAVKLIARERIDIAERYRLHEVCAIQSNYESSKCAKALAGAILTDPVLIAGRLLIERTSQLINNVSRDRFDKAILKEAMRKWPESRRDLRRIRSSRWGSNFKEEARRTSMRKVLRLASRIGMLNELRGWCYTGRSAYSDDSYIGETRPFARCHVERNERYPHYRPIKNTLIVTTNIHQATSYLRYGDLVEDEEGGCVVPILKIGIKETEKRAEIEKLAERYDIELIELEPEKRERAKPRPRSTPTVEKFYGFADFKIDYSYGSAEAIAPTLEKADVFIRCRIAEKHMTLPRDGLGKNELAQIRSVFPDLAFITTNKQEEALREAGAVSIKEAIEKRLNEVKDRADVQYACLIDRNNMINGYYHSTGAYMAVRLARRDLRLAKMLFPADVDVDAEDLPKIVALLRLATASPWTRVVNEISKNGLDTFDRTRPNGRDALDRFNYLTVLDSAKINTYPIDDLIAVVGFLQQRNDKSSLTENANTTKERKAA